MSAYSNACECFIEVDGRLVNITNGYIKNRRLDFFYLSKDEQFVRMRFSDALRSMRWNIEFRRKKQKKWDKVKRRRRLMLKEKQLSFNFQRIKFGRTKRKLVNNSLSNAISIYNAAIYDTRKENYVHNNNIRNSIDYNEKINNACVDVAKLDIDELTHIDDSFNSDKVRHPNNTTTGQTRIIKDPGALIIELDMSIINIIIKWCHENAHYPLFKKKRQRVYTSLLGNTNYMNNVLYALNPFVEIKNNAEFNNFMIDYKERNHLKISKEEFAGSLGLQYVGNTGNESANESNEELHISKNIYDFSSSKSDSESDTKSVNKKNNKKWFKKSDVLWRDSSATIKKNNTKNENKVKNGIVNSKSLYVPEEDRIILNWILKGSNASKVNGNQIWKDLERTNTMPCGVRTWQSLRNRFVKTILYKLRDYGLSSEEELKIKTGAEKGMIKFRSRRPNCAVKLNKNTSSAPKLTEKQMYFENEKGSHKQHDTNTKSPNKKSKRELLTSTSWDTDA